MIRQSRVIASLLCIGLDMGVGAEGESKRKGKSSFIEDVK